MIYCKNYGTIEQNFIILYQKQWNLDLLWEKLWYYVFVSDDFQYIIYPISSSQIKIKVRITTKKNKSSPGNQYKDEDLVWFIFPRYNKKLYFINLPLYNETHPYLHLTRTYIPTELKSQIISTRNKVRPNSAIRWIEYQYLANNTHFINHFYPCDIWVFRA